MTCLHPNASLVYIGFDPASGHLFRCNHRKGMRVCNRMLCGRSATGVLFEVGHDPAYDPPDVFHIRRTLRGSPDESHAETEAKTEECGEVSG